MLVESKTLDIANIVLFLFGALMIIIAFVPFLFVDTESTTRTIFFNLRCNEEITLPIFLNGGENLSFYFSGNITNYQLNMTDPMGSKYSLNTLIGDGKQLHSLQASKEGFNVIEISNKKCSDLNPLLTLSYVIKTVKGLDYKANFVAIGSIMVSFSLGYIVLMWKSKFNYPLRKSKTRKMDPVNRKERKEESENSGT
ncbi:hypothetical protein NMY3_00383 [Candidatus Nitrosocosmicus oleophilus]|uniref:Uncharacterized protein n=1 Tax=Candidatus Nitrosocosmicus oleophilus TaxID=1353260 RepID=A0A654LUC7_9ARCH|nr:hypothetical protein [Candidatus Nitrosocosmicus oleophilus]ALI34597.1 hypothetical protein NMY3_00383 [Candidatus Nitrosocosmicus oleophilus]